MEGETLPDEMREQSFDVHLALQNVILYGVLPLWIIPGFFDYIYHRKSKIESTSGAHESLIHVLQMTSIGIPTLMTLLLKINAPVIGIVIAATAIHEGLTLWDIAYAEPLRRPEPNEQHAHSFLEVLPLMALTSVLTLHPGQTAALFGRGNEAPEWRLQTKKPPLSSRYIGVILTAITIFLAIPYGEELLRCLRVDGNVTPHRAPDPGPQN